MIIGEAEIEIRPDASNFNRDVERGVLGNARRLGGVAAGVVAALGVSKIVRDIGRIGQEYEGSLNTFQSVSQANAAQMNKVREAAKALGNDLELPGLSAAGAAEAMTELAKAGLSVDEAMTAAKGTLQLAIAAQIDGAEAARIQGAALTQFNLAAGEAGMVADVLANTANAAAGEITDVGLALSYVGPIAEGMSISIADTAAAVGVLANQGILGEKAGTALRGVIASLANPSNKARAALAELGIEAFNSQGQFVGLRSLTEQLAEAQGRLTEEQFAGAAAAAFGREPLAAINALATGGAEAFDSMAEAVNRQGGAAEVAAAKSRGLVGAIDAFKSTVETIQIDLYERAAPGLERLVRGFTGVLPAAASGLLTGVDTLAGAVAEAAATVGPPLQIGLQSALDTIRVDVLPMVTGIATSLRDQAGEAGVGLVDGITTAVQTGEFGPLGEAIGSALATAVQGAASTGAQLTVAIGELLMGIDWANLAVQLGEQAPALLLGLVIGILSFDIGAVFQVLADNWLAALLGALSILFAPAKLLGPIASLLGRIPLVGPLLKWLFDGFTGLIKGAGGKIGEFLSFLGRSFLDGFARVFPGIGTGFLSHLRNLPTYIGVIALELVDRAKGMMTGLVNAVGSGIGRVVSKAGEIVAGFLRPFAAAPAMLRAAGSRVIDGLIGGLLSRFPGVFSTLVNLGVRIRSAISNPGAMLRRVGSAIVDGLVSGLRSAAGRVVSAARALVDKIPSAIRDLLGIRSPSRVTTIIGEQIAAGLVAGLNLGRPSVALAAQQMAASVLRGVSAGDIAGAASRAMMTEVDRAWQERDARQRVMADAANAYRLAATEETHRALVDAEKSLGDAQMSLADAIYKQRMDLLAKAREQEVSVAEEAADRIKSYLDDILARSRALTSAFASEVLAGSSIGDLFSQRTTDYAKATEDALRGQEDAAKDVVTALTAVARAQEALDQQRLAERDAEAAVQAAAAQRIVAEQQLAAARAAATDGLEATQVELVELKTAHDAVKDATAAEAKAIEALNKARGLSLDGESAETTAAEALALAQAELTAAREREALAAQQAAQAQQAAGNVFTDVLADLQGKMTDAQVFADRVGALAGLGLNEKLLQQVVDLGPQLGIALADSIIAAGPAGAAQMNELATSLGQVATDGITQVARDMFGPGASIVGGLIDGIRSAFPELSATVDELEDLLSSITGITRTLPGAGGGAGSVGTSFSAAIADLLARASAAGMTPDAFALRSGGDDLINRIRQIFVNRSVALATGTETERQRLERIAAEVAAGRTLESVRASVDRLAAGGQSVQVYQDIIVQGNVDTAAADRLASASAQQTADVVRAVTSGVR